MAEGTPISEATLPTENEDVKLENESSDVVGGDPKLRSLLSGQYESAQKTMRYMSLDWDEYENILLGQYRNNNSQSSYLISEGSLASIVIERAGRTVAQVPSGSVDALSIQDTGKSLLMDLVVQKYVIPNAIEQYPFEMKLWMWDLYSNVYGFMPMLYDWVDRDDYTGPDCWLIPVRNFFIQQGRFSPQNADYCFVSTSMSREWVQELCEDEVNGYDLEACQELLERTKDKALKPKKEDDYLRTNPSWYYRRRAPYTDTGQIDFVTKYESGDDGRWITFAPDYDNLIIRNIPNPHKNGKIPIVVKWTQPLMESVAGLGDMERGRYNQYALDDTLNLQIASQKLRVYPPIKVVKGNVTMPTVRFVPGAKWLVDNQTDIAHHQLPNSEPLFDQSSQLLQASLHNIAGVTTTSAPGNSDASTPGKTPEAIKSQNQDQSTRDEQEVKMFLSAYEELMEGFVNLINTNQDKPIQVYLFRDEIDQIIQSGYDDVKDMVKYKGKKNGVEIQDAKAVMVEIQPTRIKNSKGYQFRVDPSSSMAQDQEKEHERIGEIVELYIKDATTVEAILNQGGQTLDAGELFKRYFISGGIKDWKNIIKPMATQSEPGEMGASNTGAAGAAAQGQQAQKVSVSLSGKLGPDSTVSAEQQAGLQPDSPQSIAQVSPQPVQPAAPILDGQIALAHQKISDIHNQIVGGVRG